MFALMLMGKGMGLKEPSSKRESEKKNKGKTPSFSFLNNPQSGLVGIHTVHTLRAQNTRSVLA